MLPLIDRITQANALLSPHAVPHEGRLGRRVLEPEDAIRFPFERDRDRIIHCAAFRRLQGKTQVFVTGEDDHVRTRLTHTMEVAQIARDLARALRLNEDLVECIALAHDLGHPPFGHAGEKALDAWMQKHGGHFEHNEQSLHIITLLEKHAADAPGLNLNREVEQGLLKHSETIHHSWEALLCNHADAIAYLSHDCDDGLHAGLLSMEELLTIPLARKAYERTLPRGTFVRGALIDLMSRDLLTHSVTTIAFSPAMQQSMKQLRTFLFDTLYLHPDVRRHAEEGMRVITLLCNAYYAHPSDKVNAVQERTGTTLPEAVKDYVAGMTDAFAIAQATDAGLLSSFPPAQKRAY